MVQFDPDKHGLRFVEYENGVSVHRFQIVDRQGNVIERHVQGVSSLLKQSIVPTKPESSNTFGYEYYLSNFTGTQAHAIVMSELFGTRAPSPDQMTFEDPPQRWQNDPSSKKPAVNVYANANRSAQQMVMAVRSLERQGYVLVGGELPILGTLAGGKHYAGIADLVMQGPDGNMYVYDFKTNKVNPTRISGGRYERFSEKYPFQLSLYANADYIARSVDPFVEGTSRGGKITGTISTGMVKANLRTGAVIWYPAKPNKGEAPDQAVIAALRSTPELKRAVEALVTGQQLKQLEAMRIGHAAYESAPGSSSLTAAPVHPVFASTKDWLAHREKLPTVGGKVPRLANFSKGRQGEGFKAVLQGGNGSFIVFDLETTGLAKPYFDKESGKWMGSEIWEIGATKYDRQGHVKERFHRIFNPERGFPDDIKEKFNVDEEKLKGHSPISAQDLLDLHKFIGDNVSVGYNSKSFDIPFLRRYAERFGQASGEDGLFGAKFEGRHLDFYNFLQSQGYQAKGSPFAKISQDFLRQYLGLSEEFAHYALGDTYATASIMDAYIGGKLDLNNLDLDKLQRMWEELKPGEMFLDPKETKWTPSGQLITEGVGKGAKKAKSSASRVANEAARNVDSLRPPLIPREIFIKQYRDKWYKMLKGVAERYKRDQGYDQEDPVTGRPLVDQEEIDGLIKTAFGEFSSKSIAAALRGVDGQNGIYDKGEEYTKKWLNEQFDKLTASIDNWLGDAYSHKESNASERIAMPEVSYYDQRAQARKSGGGGSANVPNTPAGGGSSDSGSSSGSGGAGAAGGSGAGGAGGGGGHTGAGDEESDESPEERRVRQLIADAKARLEKAQKSGNKLNIRTINQELEELYKREREHTRLRASFEQSRETITKMVEAYDAMKGGTFGDEHKHFPGPDQPFAQMFHGWVQAQEADGILGERAGAETGTALRSLSDDLRAKPGELIDRLSASAGKGFTPGRAIEFERLLAGRREPKATSSINRDDVMDAARGALQALGWSDDLIGSSPSPMFQETLKRMEEKARASQRSSGGAGGSGSSGGSGDSGGSGGGGFTFSGFGDDGGDDSARRNAEEAARQNRMFVRAMAGYGQTDTYKVGSYETPDKDKRAKWNPAQKLADDRARKISEAHARMEQLGFAIPNFDTGVDEFWNPKTQADAKIGGEVKKALEDAGLKASQLAQRFIAAEIEATVSEAEREATGRRGSSGLSYDKRYQSWLTPDANGVSRVRAYDNQSEAIQSVAKYGELQLQMKRGAAYQSYVEAGLHPDIAYTLSQGDYNAAKNDMAAKAARDAKRQRSGTTGTIQHLFESTTGSSSPLDFIGSRALRTGVWATSGMLYYGLADGMKKDWDSVKEMQRDQVALEQALGYSQPNAPRGYASKVSNQVMGMSSQFGFNPEHIMDVALALQGSMSSAGSTPDQRLNNTMDATKAVVLLSKVGHVELQQSMENLVAISNAYRQPDIAALTKSGNAGAAAALTPGKEMMNAVNGLTALSNKYSVNMEQTSTAMARMGDIFQTMGVDSGTAAGWLGAIQQNTGESGLQITSKLERVFPQFLDPTTQGKVAEILGPAGVLNFADLQGTPDAKKVMDAVGEAYSRYKSGDKSGPQLNEGQVMQFAMATGGPRGYGEVMKLIENYGLAQQMSKTYNSGAGTKAAEERWDALSKTALERTKELSGAWLQLVKNVASSGLLQTFGALAGVMTKLAQAANGLFGLFDRFTNALGPLGTLIRGIVGIGVGTAAYRMVFNSNRTLGNIPVLSSFVGNTRSMRGEYYSDMTLRQALRSVRNPNMSMLSGEKAERDRLEWKIRQAGSLNFDESDIATVKPIVFGLKAGISDVLPSFGMLGRALRKLTSDAESSGSGTPGRFARFRARLGSDKVDENGNIVKPNRYRQRFLDAQLLANGFSSDELTNANRADMAAKLEKNGIGAAQIGTSRLAMMAGRAAVPAGILASGAMAIIGGYTQAGMNAKTRSQFEQTYGRQFYGNDNGAKIAAIDQALQSGSNLSGAAVSIANNIPIVGGAVAAPAYETGITLTGTQLAQARSMRQGADRATGFFSDFYQKFGEYNILNPFGRRDKSATPNQLRNYEAYLNAQKDKVNQAVIADAATRHATILSPQDAQYEVQAYMKSALYGSQAYDLYATGTLPGGTQQIISGQYKTATGADVEKTLQSQIGGIDTQLAEYAKMNASGSNYVDQETIKELAAQRQDFQQQLIEYRLARRAASELLQAVKGSEVDQAVAQFTNAMDKWKSFGSKDTAEAMQAASDALNAAFGVAQAAQNQRMGAIQGLGSTAVTPIAQTQVAGQLMNASIGYYQLLQKNAPDSAQTFQAGLGMLQSWRSYQDTVHQNNMSMIDAQGNLAASQTMDPLAQVKARRKAAEDKIAEIQRYQNSTETFNTGNSTLDKFLEELKTKATDPMKEASDAFKQASDLSNSAANVQSTAASVQVQAANTQAAAATAMGTAISGLNMKLGGSPYAGSSALDSTFPLPGGLGGPDTSMAANKPGGSIYSSQVPKYSTIGSIGDNLKGDANAAKRAAHGVHSSISSVKQSSAVPSVKAGSGWANDILTALGMPVTSENVKFLNAWAQAEGTKAGYNPLATTQGMSGATNFNSVGVKNYASYGDGIAATVKTLRNGNYGGILAALANGNSAVAAAQAVASSPWGTGSGVLKVLGAGGGKNAPKLGAGTAWGGATDGSGNPDVVNTQAEAAALALQEAVIKAQQREAVWLKDAGAASKEKQVTAQIKATKDMISTLQANHGDPVEIANEQKQLAELYYEQAQRDIDRYAQAWRLKFDDSNKYMTLKEQATELQKQMDAYLKAGGQKNDAEYQKMAADKKDALRDAGLQKVEYGVNDLTYSFNMHETSWTNYINGLKKFRDSVDKSSRSGLELWQQINEQILSAVESVSLNANIPTDIKVPTLYEVRRFIGAGLNGQNYMGTSTPVNVPTGGPVPGVSSPQVMQQSAPNVSIQVNGADTAFVLQVMSQYLGPANMTRSTYTTTRRV